jgi:hypothetical protein
LPLNLSVVSLAFSLSEANEQSLLRQGGVSASEAAGAGSFATVVAGTEQSSKAAISDSILPGPKK